MEERDENGDGGQASLIGQLLVKYRCDLKHCSNYGLACLSNGTRNHFKLNSNDLKKWHIAILANKATLDAPPMDLHPMFAKTSRKRRSSRDYSSDGDDNYDSYYSRRDRGSQNISIYLHQGSE